MSSGPRLKCFDCPLKPTGERRAWSWVHGRRTGHRYVTPILDLTGTPTLTQKDKPE